MALSVGGKAQRVATRNPPAVLFRIDGLAILLYWRDYHGPPLICAGTFAIITFGVAQVFLPVVNFGNLGAVLVLTLVLSAAPACGSGSLRERGRSRALRPRARFYLVYNAIL